MYNINKFMASFMFIIINWCFTVDLFICIVVITTVGFDIFCPLIHLLFSYFLRGLSLDNDERADAEVPKS